MKIIIANAKLPERQASYQSGPNSGMVPTSFIDSIGREEFCYSEDIEFFSIPPENRPDVYPLNPKDCRVDWLMNEEKMTLALRIIGLEERLGLYHK